VKPYLTNSSGDHLLVQIALYMVNYQINHIFSIIFHFGK